MESFAQRKARTLEGLALDAGDASRAGHVDARARPIVALVNRLPHFYTTSSCSGRVSLFADPTPASRAAGMKGGEWVYVSHDPADADAVVSAVRRKLGEGGDGRGSSPSDPTDAAAARSAEADPECTLVLRFEPFILSVEASSVEEALRFVAAARDAGYRESGITASDKRAVCSVRCSIRMETPVVVRGARLVADDALRALVRVANEKWDANARRAERLEERVRAVFGDPAGDPAGGTGTGTGIGTGSRTGTGSGSPPRAPGWAGGDEPEPEDASLRRRLASSLPRFEDASAADEEWVFVADASAAKRCKDSIKASGWLDRTRRAGPIRRGRGGREGGDDSGEAAADDASTPPSPPRVALPVTAEGARALRPASTKGGGVSSLPESARAAEEALASGAATLVASGPGAGPGEPDVLPRSERSSDRSEGFGFGALPRLARRAAGATPAALVRAAALAACAHGADPRRRDAQIPTRWEKLGDLALLPSGAFSDDALWGSPSSRASSPLFPAVARALGVTRLARQAEVSKGPKRESRAEMLWDPEGRGGWTETRELGVWYGLDVTEVMFSSGNGTEKARMGALAAAGETVVDLFAGIGYYTLQLLVNAGVGRVIACEWNPNSVRALRRNLERNGVDARRCEVREGDNRRVAPVGCADRVLLGLLPDSERAWPVAVAALRDSGGVLHAHANVKQGELEGWISRLEAAVADLAAKLGREWSVRVEHVERVKWYAPRVRHVVADVRCVPARLASAWAHAVGASTSPMARSPAVGSPLEGSRLGSGADLTSETTRPSRDDERSDEDERSDGRSVRSSRSSDDDEMVAGKLEMVPGKKLSPDGHVAPTSSPRAAPRASAPRAGYVKGRVRSLEERERLEELLHKDPPVTSPTKRGGPGGNANVGASVPSSAARPSSPPAAAPPPRARVVARMHRPDFEAFRSGPATRREPCVLTGLDVGPAPWTWSPAYLAAKPEIRDAEVSVHVSRTRHLDFVRKNFKYETKTLGDVFARLADEEAGAGAGEAKTWYYLRSIGENPRKEAADVLRQFPVLASELRVPAETLFGESLPRGRDAPEDADAKPRTQNPGRFHSAVLRCSSGGVRLWTHYDAMDNALVQLHGEKRVLLFPPATAAGLYLENSSSPVVGAAVDRPEGARDDRGRAVLDAYPGYRAARREALEVILQPGDVLFIPALWAHHVEALHGPSVAVNVFWRELAAEAYPRKDLYANADPTAAAEALKLSEDAAGKLAGLPRQHRVFYGGLAVANVLRTLRIETEIVGLRCGTEAGADARAAGAPGAEAGAAGVGAEVGAGAAAEVGGGEGGTGGGVVVGAGAAWSHGAAGRRWTDAAMGAAFGAAVAGAACAAVLLHARREAAR